MRRVLVPGAGGPGAVNMTRGLKMAPEPVFTVGCDANPYFLHLALTDERVLVPRASHEDAYVEAIRDVCIRYAIDVVMPNSSIEMMVLTKHRDQIPAAMLVPSLATQELAASKWLTWKRWKEAGISVPLTMLIEKPEDVERAFDTIKSRPIWFRGSGIPGRGIGAAALPCSRPIQALGWIDFHDGWGRFIASEYLPGENLTFLALLKKGRLITSQGRQRDAYVIPHVSPSGITGAPAISHTVNRGDLNELGHAAILAIDPQFDGAAFVDFKGSSDGRLLPTEINAGRLGTTHHFYTVAGVNFPYLLLKLALNEPIPFELKQYDALPPDLWWVRTLDAGPVLLRYGASGLEIVTSI